jgi:predicted Zn-dependent peptidase
MDIQRRTLSSGLEVVYLKLPISSVSLVVSVGVGFRDESEEYLGVSHLLEHLLFDGTKNYPSEFIFSEAAEKLGGDVNGTTDEYCTSFELRAASDDFKEAVQLVSELVQAPLLNKENVEKEKNIIKAEMLSKKDFLKKNPVKTMLYNYLDGFDQLDYLDQEIKALPSLTHEKVLTHFEKYYSPKNMVLGIVGNIEHPFDIIESAFSKNKESNLNRVIPKFNFPNAKIERVKDKDEVSSIYFSWFGPGIFSTERAVFEVVAKIIAKGENGVVKAIRFDEGLAYEVDAFLNADERKGVFIVSVKTSKEHMQKVENIVKEKVALVRSVSINEVEQAKKSVLAENILEMEDYLEVARVISNTELYKEKTPFEGLFEQIKKVTADDVKEFAEKYLKDNFVLITSK